MKAYEVGIIGHKSYRFYTTEEIISICRSTLITLMDQYESNNLRINITGSPGLGMLMGKECLEYGVDVQLFLPCSPQLYIAEWSDDHKNTFNNILDNCTGLMTVGTTLDKDNICDANKALVDDSNFIVSFWEGIKYGITYETTKYAFESSKIVLDGLDDLSLITKKDLNGKQAE